jgi:alpha-L-rhamnosidase
MQGTPARLRCEYLDSPLGIDVARPRLSWCIGDDRPAELQTAYQILAASHPDVLDMGEGDFWDSGRVEGGDTSQIEYGGKPLTSGRRIWWKVRSFDSDGLPGPWSDPASFEMGLIGEADWQGRWISSGLEGSRTTGVPVALFGRRFTLSEAPRGARLYVAALGQTAIQVNGRRLDGAEQSPDWVDYTRRAPYVALDVTEALRAGDNCLAVLLADGWYAGSPGGGYRQQYGSKPWLLVQLNVDLGDGRSFSLVSDNSWRWQPSWILSSDPSQGECLDGRRWRDDWIGEGPDGSDWYRVVLGESSSDAALVMTPAIDRAIAAHPVVPGAIPVEPKAGDGVIRLFRFEEPLLGRARVDLNAPAGGTLRVRYGLALDEQGALLANGQDVYTARGDEQGESFEAMFALHGFRFVEVSGDFYREDAVSAHGVAIGRRPTPAATLVTDHPVLNDLHGEMAAQLARTQQSVPFLGLNPEDRLGAVVTFGRGSNALLTNLDAMPVVTDWVRNMADGQFAEGGFPMVVPAPPGEEVLSGEGPAGSSDAFIEVLWQLYRHAGDRRLLRAQFGAVKQMLAGAVADTRDFIRGNLDSESDYPADLAGTAWLYRSARMSARIAGVLGNLSDLEDCEELATNVRNAFRRRFVTPDGRVIGDNVPVYALVLGVGLLDPTEQAHARRSLFEGCEAALARSGAALLAVPFLLRVLTDHGRLDLAYRLVLESGFRVDPSAGGLDVGALVAAGVDDWLFGVLAGLAPSRDLSDRCNAFRHMMIQPRPPLGFGFDQMAGEPPVRAVEVTRRTINGCFESSWAITDTAFELKVHVPGNCSAEVVLPDGSATEVGAGDHEFRMAFGEAGDGIPVLREVS